MKIFFCRNNSVITEMSDMTDQQVEKEGHMSSQREDSKLSGAAASVVTGAFGFSGQHIARKLLARGEHVRTLTNHPQSGSPLSGQLQVFPLDFENAQLLVESMLGASVLYNTYWVRFSYGEITHERAVHNTMALIRAAETAGVKRIVHVSITNPALDSPLPYFKGKAELEQAIRSSSLSHAILRPAVLFGAGDILINNIAFLLKRFPVFAIPGDGEYRIQPVFVEDLAELAVESGRRTDSITVDAVGPESYTYTELVKLIRAATRSRAAIVYVPPALLCYASGVLGKMLKDVVLTDDEIKGLMANLLVSHAPPTGRTSLKGWLEAHAKTIGSAYVSELSRHYKLRKGGTSPVHPL